jgi:glycosyl hydrolase family 42 (putative beta-galactosidase)
MTTLKLTAIFTILFGIITLTAYGENLIPNSGFEITNKTGMPTDWFGNFYGADKKGNIKLNRKTIHSGKTAITISGFEQGVTGQFMHTRVKVSPKAVYNFDIWYKSQKPLEMQLRWFGKNGKLTGIHTLIAPPSNGTWGNFAGGKSRALFAVAKNGKLILRFKKVPIHGFIAPPESYKLQLVVFVKNIGSATIDDLSFQQIIKNTADEQEQELQRLMIADDSKEKKNVEHLKLDIKDVQLPENYEMTKEKYPETATNIRSRDGIFYRNKTAAFLFGMESAALVYPWQFRLLGMDIIHMGSTYELGVIRTKKQDKNLKIWWQDYKWAEVLTRELLKNGLAVYVQPIEITNKNNHPVAKYFPEAFVNASHFISYRFGNPLGDRLRENYIKCFIKTFRKYPITMWELFNEVRYADYSSLNIKNFRISMHHKYGSIEQANKAWKTNFKSFDTVDPPRKSGSYSFMINITPKNFSQALWSDWGIFIEKTFGVNLQKVAAIYRKYEKNPNSYLTVQSVCDLPMGFSSLGGVNPYEKYKAENVYSHEDRGAIFYRQGAGSENTKEIKIMLINQFVWNFLRKVSPDKPLLGVECSILGGAPKRNNAASIIKLDGDWKFMPDNSNNGFKNSFYKPGYDDLNWKNIKVPGLWGTQGYAKCKLGWYRKKFFVPNKLKGVKLFLNGYQLTDFANIYLNGKLIRSTKIWNEQFADEITAELRYGKENILAISIANNYLSGDMYWGGIRKYISIDCNSFGKVYPLSAGQMRWWIWSRMLHDFSGVIMSYAYSSDSSNLSMFRPNKNSFASIRVIPEVKKEIESILPIIGPRPRLTSKVAIVYPLNYGRYSVQKTPSEWVSAPLMQALLNWYCGTLFSQVEIDVISCREILKGKLKDYKLLFMPVAPLSSDAVDSKVKAFISNGGTLVASEKTMTMNSDNYAKKSNAWLFANDIGKGKVYKVKAVPTFLETAQIVKNILKQTGIKPEVAVSGKGKTKYIETHLSGRDGRYICTAFNWGGGGGKIKLHLNTLPQGDYHVRVLPGGEELADISNGTILTEIKSHQPIILLLEKPGLRPINIKQMSAKQQKFVKLWKPSKQGGTPVLLSSGMNEIIGRSRILTAMNLLEHNNYSFDIGLSRFKQNMKVFTDREEVKKLDSFKIVVTMGSGLGGERVFKSSEAALMREYVKNGGSLLIAANHYVGPHGWLSNAAKNPLLKEFGVSAFNRNINDLKNYDFVPDYPAFTDITPHPVTNGVKKFQSHGMPVMKVNNSEAKILIRAANGSPVLISVEYGKGRVVIIGDGKWLQPLPLAKADNARLLLNIFNWLSRRPPSQISDKKIMQEVDYKF